PIGVGECRQSPSMSEAPFDDESLVCFVPEVCQPARIIEAVSGIEGHRGGALAAIEATGDGDMVLVSADHYAGPAASTVAFGTVEDLRDIVDGDASASCDVNLSTQPDGTIVLWAVPGLEIIAENIGYGFRPGVRAYFEGTGLTVVVGTELHLDTD